MRSAALALEALSALENNGPTAVTAAAVGKVLLFVLRARAAIYQRRSSLAAVPLALFCVFSSCIATSLLFFSRATIQVAVAVISLLLLAFAIQSRIILKQDACGGALLGPWYY